MTTLYVHGRPEARGRRQRRIALTVLTTAGLLACAGWVLRDTEAPVGAATETATETASQTTATALDPELAARFAAAQAAAFADGVELTLTSGWRSVADQEVLVAQTLDRYGDPEAHRWVLPPEHSAHVQGLAIDVGPTEGAYWLAQHGIDLGLCQTYTNEIWHYEKLPDGAGACPEPYPDSSWAW